MDRFARLRGRWKRLAAGLVCLGGWVSPTLADHPQAFPSSPTGHYFGSGCYKPCPKPMYVAPMPTVPGTTPGRTMPPDTTPPGTTPPGTTPPDTTPTTAPETDLSASLGSQATESQASYAPSMFGDQFGGGTFRSITTSFTPGTPPVIRTVPFTIMTNSSSPGMGMINATYSGNFGQTMLTTSQSPLFVGGQPVSAGTITAAQPLVNVSPGMRSAVLETSSITSAVATLAQPGEMVQFNSSSAAILQSSSPPSPPSFPGAGFYFIEEVYDFITPGSPGSISQVIIDIPTPSAGGFVGRTKISDDNSPLPRDRIIFNYDYFDATAFGFRDVNVNRFAPGIERTFLDRRASVEVRVPFASTLDSNIVSDGITNTNTELGNVIFILKGLLVRGETLNVGGGLGIAIPTSDDIAVNTMSGTPVARIENETVLLTPYFAALFTPNENLFVQTWLQFAFDASGSPVQLNPTGAGLIGVGRLTDTTIMSLDAQMGYWLARSNDPDRLLRGLAPFVEMHYNTTISNFDTVSSGGVTVRDLRGSYDELNLTAGVIAQIGSNFNLSVGMVAPLRDGDDRFFDYQIGVRGNFFFGPTAAARDQAIQASSF